MEKIDENMLILAQNQYYNQKTYETKLNNNVLVVGTSGAGKTRGIVEPNLLQAVGSYIVSDPKGNLYNKYKSYLISKGYKVIKLDFTDPESSEHYNFFRYIHSTLDIVKVAHMLIYQEKNKGHLDPFWDQAAQLLIQACIGFLLEQYPIDLQNFGQLMDLVSLCDIDENDSSAYSELDMLMHDLGREDPHSYPYKTYKKFRIAAGKTLRSILISVNSRIGLYDIPEITEMMRDDTIDIPSIGKKKTALFVVVSDTDRSMDGLANVFFSQAINELCRYADKECKNCCLPVPTRFILDDFATNVRIAEFPRMISSIRSRGISTMLMIQAESQLKEAYNEDGRTIIGNCDTYVYLGGNDVETAKAIAERCDKPLKKVLNMPVGMLWIFRRGQEPVYARGFDIDEFRKLKIKAKGELERF